MQVALCLLREPQRGQKIREGLGFADDCAKVIAQEFRKAFGKPSKKSDRERYMTLKARMVDAYWSVLQEPFLQKLVPAMTGEQWQRGFVEWVNVVKDQAYRQFTQ